MRLGPPTSAAAAVAATKYSVAAALTFLLYDHTLTFEDELQYVWRRPGTLGKILFILNRYFALISLIIQTFVFFRGSLTNKVSVKVSFIGTLCRRTLVIVVSAEIILVARIYAVYDCNKRLLAFLMVLGAMEFIVSLVTELVSLPNMPAVSLPNQTGCYILRIPSFTFIVWIPAIIIEITLLSLMLYKAWQLFRQGGNFPLMQLLLRDSILYFSSNVAVLMVNCFIWIFNRNIIDEFLLSSWALAVPCAMVSRLLLNMRRQYYTQLMEKYHWRCRHSRSLQAYCTRDPSQVR
ncbi:hypothetical protein K439DRAFT_592262 [Ramaria rubella]|nr:hypothetical protein K439DRAFT_592262 [Ramaria rubella]